jgi:hypothetical protein
VLRLRVGRETRRLGVIRCSLSEGMEAVTAFWADFVNSALEVGIVSWDTRSFGMWA